MMHNLLCLLLIAMASMSASAANVLWDKFIGERLDYLEDAFSVNYYGYIDGTIESNPEIQFTHGMHVGEFVPCGANASVTELWLLMNPGDIASYETIRSADKYLFRTFPSYASDYNITMYHGDMVYLAFESIESAEKSIYGWVSLSFNYGTLSVVSSAFDADGGPMIVGGGAYIPEPSSALLLLVGGACLALRRRRRCMNSGAQWILFCCPTESSPLRNGNLRLGKP